MLMTYKSRQFFNMPLEQKLKSPHPPAANPHRGFTPAGVENVSAVSSYGRTAESPALPLLKDMKVCLLKAAAHRPDFDIFDRNPTTSDLRMMSYTAIFGPQEEFAMTSSPFL
jgi:hypothetical protein